MAVYKTWAAWMHGLIAVVVSSIATGGMTYLTAQVTGLDLKPRQFFLTVGIGSLVSAFAFLKESPLPFNENIPITQIPTPPPAPQPVPPTV